MNGPLPLHAAWRSAWGTKKESATGFPADAPLDSRRVMAQRRLLVA